jgi:hypothetical protein
MEEHAVESRGFHVSSVHNGIASIADGFIGELMVVPYAFFNCKPLGWNATCFFNRLQTP